MLAKAGIECIQAMKHWFHKVPTSMLRPVLNDANVVG